MRRIGFSYGISTLDPYGAHVGEDARLPDERGAERIVFDPGLPGI